MLEMKFSTFEKVCFLSRINGYGTFLGFFFPVFFFFSKESVRLNTQRGRLTSGIFLTFKTD